MRGWIKLRDEELLKERSSQNVHQRMRWEHRSRCMNLQEFGRRTCGK
jgi:hypothetical protein